MKEDMHIQTERIDDFVVLLALMQQMGLPELLDRHLARHRLQQGLSWGWTATVSGWPILSRKATIAK